MPGRTDRHWRSAAVLGVLVILAAVGVLRLAFWQVVMGPELSVRAMGQIQRTADVPAVRGDILDRHGRVLATTGFRDSLNAYPEMIDDTERETIVEGLGEILGLDEAERTHLRRTTLDPKLKYAVIERELTEDQSWQVRSLISSKGLGDLQLLPHAVRIYPNPGGQPGTSLASQLLGFVLPSTGAGLYGIEGHYDAVLAGTPKRVAVARDRFSQPLESSELVLDPGIDGRDIRLSIDASLQLQLEKELLLAYNADDARRVSGIVMDPDNGEILAWASVPGYDANDITSTDKALFLDPNVSQVYEPGSVMKMMTATAALEAKRVTPQSRILDNRVITFGPDKVRNADKSGMGRIPFRDVIAYSRNVGVSKVAKRLGRNTVRASRVLYRTWEKLGIGQLTGVDVSGEVAGIAADPERNPWAPIDLANRSFGQGVAVTLVQLVNAFAPMADGGMRVQPHFLVAIGDETQPAADPVRVMRKKTAKQVRDLLMHVTGGVAHYAEGSLIRGWEVGGKTGTAQIWRQRAAAYDYDTFNFTFVGYVGGDQPEAVVGVRIHEADPDVKGPGDLRLNITSYELFRRVARGVIASLDIRRSSDPNAGLPEAGSDAERALETAGKRRREARG
ncbi:MAG: penicillin-binding protein 2 [Candidatus Limnocylindrales bacterium]